MIKIGNCDSRDDYYYYYYYLINTINILKILYLTWLHNENFISFLVFYAVIISLDFNY